MPCINKIWKLLKPANFAGFFAVLKENSCYLIAQKEQSKVTYELLMIVAAPEAKEGYKKKR